MPEITDEKQQIDAARQGDEKALLQLIHTHHRTIERFARQIGVKDQDIQDVVQEVFIKMYRFLHQYSRGKFTTWLYRITYNVINDYYRKSYQEKRKFERVVQHAPTTFVEDNLELSEDAKLLREALQRLEEKYRVPIILFYFHELSIKEIANITNKREATIKTWLRRGKEKLKIVLQEGGYPNES